MNYFEADGKQPLAIVKGNGRLMARILLIQLGDIGDKSDQFQGESRLTQPRRSWYEHIFQGPPNEKYSWIRSAV